MAELGRSAAPRLASALHRSQGDGWSQRYADRSTRRVKDNAAVSCPFASKDTAAPRRSAGSTSGCSPLFSGSANVYRSQRPDLEMKGTAASVTMQPSEGAVRADAPRFGYCCRTVS